MIVSRHGFSLLELSVVLVLLGLIVGFGVNIGQTAVKGSSRLTTQERMALVKESLDAYAARNGYLPCPADPALLPSTANYGLESRGAAGAGCLSTGGVFSTAGVWFGTLPVRNLGLDEGYVSDVWGNKLTYAVSENHNGNTLALPTAISGGWNSYADRTGTITVNSGTIAAPVTISSTRDLANGSVPGAGATYVVISHGPNGRGAYGMDSTAAKSCTAGFIDTQNCDRNNAVFFDSTYNDGAQTTTQFDDYVVWGSNTAARTPVDLLPDTCPAGVCETWCAPCERPPSMPMAVLSTPPVAATRICAKFITRNLPTCEARCVWPTATMPCP